MTRWLRKSRNIHEIYIHFVIKRFQSMPRNIIVKSLVPALVTSQAYTNAYKIHDEPRLYQFITWHNHIFASISLKNGETRSGTRYNRKRRFYLSWLLFYHWTYLRKCANLKHFNLVISGPRPSTLFQL